MQQTCLTSLLNAGDISKNSEMMVTFSSNSLKNPVHQGQFTVYGITNTLTPTL
jgi:hypothetical protein